MTVRNDGFLFIEDFSNFIDIERVVYYSIKANKNKTLKIRFYDKDEKLIKPYAK
jgi:hypothetical protein